jgi:dTDP-4-amino-4,6-dideoxygalactose transaminase
MSQLAISGGTPVRTGGYPPWPVFDDREKQGLQQVLEGRNLGGFPFPNRLARQFAANFAACHDARWGISAANGTVTLEIALRSLGLEPGEEVIVPAYTFEATVGPVLQLGGIPVFVDVLPDTYCIDPAAVEAAISPRTKAIIPVHLAMNMADMDAVCALAEKHHLQVVEDCAHAHGSKWRNRGAGAWGDAGSFSLQTSKLMTAGEGGMIITNRQEVFELCQSYANCGRASETDHYGRRIIGFNYRMTEFQAAVLMAQLERLTEQTSLREERSRRLTAGLAEIEGLSALKRDPRQTVQAIYHYVFKYNPEAFGGATRNRFVAALETEGFPCDGMFYEPVYRSSLFLVNPRHYPSLYQLDPEGLPWKNVRCPNSEKAAYEESVWIPHQALLGSEGEIDLLLEAILKIQKHCTELATAEHPLIEIKNLSRASRAARCL